MRILEYEQNRFFAGDPLDEIEHRRKCSAALLGGTESERRIAPSERQRKHRRNERRLFIDSRQAPAQHRFELLEALLGRVVILESGGSFQLRNEGMQHAVGVVERTLVEKVGVLGARDALGKRRDDARFADASFAGDEHDLPLAFPGLALAFPQKRALFLTIDESGEARRMSRFETALGGDDALHRPRRDGLGKSLHLVPTEVAQAERIRKQPACGAGDDDLSGLRQALKPRCEIRRIADQRIVPQRAATAEIADDHEAARDADADRKRLRGTRFESRRTFDDVERRADGSLGIIFVSARVAEIRQISRRRENR